ncbi:type VI secretion system baseplate subunit TssE [Lacibacterium aquatile]|uniref:Type VI secretion system baseplate subunit TssE n=1 Tax=Lacibacterium aquatile TaxID=1168082 RepID=A0ABW5DTK9_9PROT
MAIGRASMPNVLDGGSVPLFDRLVDLEPAVKREAKVWRRMDVEDVKRSVAIELARLFDCRRAEGIESAAARPAGDLTVLDYGLPDFGMRSPHDLTSRRLLAAAARQAILAFEPRLIGTLVELVPSPDRPGLLIAQITAQLVVGDIVEPVTYQIALGAGGGEEAGDGS